MKITDAKKIVDAVENNHPKAAVMVAFGGIEPSDYRRAKGVIDGWEQRGEREKLIAKALNDLVEQINYSSTETLNGKYARNLNDPEEAYILGAHTFFKLIGESFPMAQKAIAAFRASEEK